MFRFDDLLLDVFVFVVLVVDVSVVVGFGCVSVGDFIDVVGDCVFRLIFVLCIGYGDDVFLRWCEYWIDVLEIVLVIVEMVVEWGVKYFCFDVLCDEIVLKCVDGIGGIFNLNDVFCRCVYV